MIEINNLTFRYQDTTKNALDGITLKVPEGGFLGIIGPSGAGKTSLTHAIDGIIPHHYKGEYFGKVTVDGMDPLENKLCDITRKIGIVFQEVDNQIVSAVVEDEIIYAMENYGIPHEEIEGRLTEALEMVGITDLRYRYISSLSGGQKQKVVIASALAIKPKILLLDEPTGELDPRSSLQVFNILKKVNEELGITIVIVEQKIKLLSDYATDIAVMKDGKIALYGTTKEVMSHADELIEIGIQCSRYVLLSKAMKDAGLGNGETCLTVDEAEQLVKEAVR